MLMRDALTLFFPWAAPAEVVSRVAILYAKYLGINGSLFDAKVLALQLMTILLQVRE